MNRSRHINLCRVLMKISGSEDRVWAQSVVDSAKKHKVGLCYDLVIEAWRKRHTHDRIFASPSTYMTAA